MNFIVTHRGVLPLTEQNISLPDHNCQQVYEVMRLIDGTALFLEDHFDRLAFSVNLSGLQLEMEFSDFKQHIAELIKLNGRQNGNVKFILSPVGNKNHWSFAFIAHSYPAANDYQRGVATGLLMAERENPNAKIIQNTIREKANQLMAERNLYEALLVDRNGMITEGSRSNVFFVKGNRFYTAPVSSVLAGVTRHKVLDCLRQLNYPIIEEAVSASESGNFDAVFLTGTSPKVLPVNCIDDIGFGTKNLFVEKLMAAYDLMIDKYLKAQKGLP